MGVAGQPLRLADILPFGMTADDFYVLLAGGAAFFCVFAIGNTLIERDRLGPRLKSLQDRRAQLRGEMGAVRRRKKPENSVNMMRSVVTRFKLLQKSQVGKTVERLTEAGWRNKDALYVFAFFNLVAPIVFAIIGFILMKMDLGFSGRMAKMQLVFPIAFTYLGFKLPTIVVAMRRRKRYRNIQKALADTLDLMMICAEAGLSLPAALDRVSKELGLVYPEFAEELSLVSIEMGFLPDRNKALSNLAERVKLAEIRGIVSVLIQTEKYGTPISQALRVLSNEFRTQRMLRAEQKAARLPALMTVPMILFILPTLFIVVISPAFLKLSMVK